MPYKFNPFTKKLDYYEPPATVGSGEANTASNLGSGEGLFTVKGGVDLPFKGIDATSTKIAVTSNASTVLIDVDESNIVHQNLSGAGTNTHTQIDSHIGDATLHFTEASIDHTAIANIGSNSHSTIDSHIGDAAKHREINDSGTAATDLWSADKIGTEIDNSLPFLNPRVVFKEQFTGNGALTTFQLDGTLLNATFSTGSWSAGNILNTHPSHVTATTKIELYDSGNVFTRNRISISSISAGGLVTLSHAPLAVNFTVWYWYEIQATDIIDDYYREDFISSMEAATSVIATGVPVNTGSFAGILSASDDEVQAALDTLDDHTHTHTGDVTGTNALTLESVAVTGQSTVTALGADYVLISDTSDSGNLKKALISDFAGGNVSNYGTPVDNQIAVWRDATTIEGTTGFTYNGSVLDITGNITLSGTVDGIDIATDVAANTLKVTNATHTGEVTGDSALTIANDAVTYAKMQNVVADGRILGNVAGVGQPVAELTASQVRTLINVADGATAVTVDDTAYDSTSWDANTDAASKNAIRDKFVLNDSAIGLNTAKVTNATHTGEVTGDTVLTITDDAVTYAKIQNVVANNVLLGNNAGAGSIVDELTATEVRSLINVADGATANLGDVVGPGSAVDNNIVTFDLTTGKLVQDGGVTLGTGTNTFSLTRGTASLDIAAGSTLDVNADLTVGGVSSIDQDVTTTGSPTFVGPDVDYIDFDTVVSAPTHQTGRMHWSADDGTVEIGLDGDEVLPLGQKGIIRVRNVTGGVLDRGTVVYQNGSSGNRPTVDAADNTDANKFHVLGMLAEDIADSGTGFCYPWGVVKGTATEPIDTSTMSAGDTLYLNSSGGWTTTHPTVATYATVVVGTVQRSHSTEGWIYVEPSKSFSIGNEFDGTIRQSVVNESTGTSAAAGFTAVNDAGHWMTVGIGGTNSTAFADNAIFYGPGYNDNLYAVDGAKSHKWYVDPTDSHNNSSLSYLSMELSSAGDLTLQRGQYVSTIVTGTAPMNVTSTTLNANFNADLLDSQEGTYYLSRANHTGTQTASTISDFQTTVSANSDVTTNSAKVTNATHTGDVTGSNALTLESVAITGQSEVTAIDTDYVLISDTSDSGNLKKALVSDFGGSSGNVSNYGTPVDNQIAVWRDATTVEGTTGLTYTGSALDITGNITLTGTVDGIDIATDVAANTLKVTNATHSGEVTGSGVLTVDPTAISNKGTVTAVGSDYVLIGDTSDSGNLKKALISDFASAGGDMAAATYDPANIAEQLVGISAIQTLTNKTLTSPAINNPTGLDANDISDFDTEVSNNTDVAANTSARHVAATVADTSSINLTLTGQQISGVVLPAGVDHDSLLNFASNEHFTMASIVIDATQVELLEIGTATYDDVQDWSNGTQSAGIISGGSITDGGSGTIDISDVKGIVKTTNSDIGENRFFDLTGLTGQTLTDNSTNYIAVDYNSGTPQFVIGTSSTANGHTIFNLGKVYREGTLVDIIDSGLHLEDIAKRIQQHHVETSSLHFVSGASVSETGTRNIVITAGVMYAGLNRIVTTGIDTSATDDFEYYYYTGSAWAESDQTQINNTQYNDIATGLETISSNKYGVHWVYKGTGTSTYVIYGQEEYTLSEAQAAQPPGTLPDHVNEFGVLRAKIIIQESDTSFTEIEAVDDLTFVSFTPSDHNELTSLQGGSATERYHLTVAEINALHPAITLDASATTGGLSLSTQAISFQAATTAQNGYLTSTDWNTFNDKVSNATHTGDVTGATTLTIANDAVTYAKMQNVVADNRILGNIAGAGGIITELTATQVRTMINVADGATANAGDVVGPGSAVDNDLTVFDSTTGKLIKDGGVVLGTGTNTFSLTRGTASLDIAAGSVLDVNANLTVSGVSSINQDVTSGAAPTFAADNFSDGGSNAIITTTQETNFETAYSHSQDNTQAHSDYLINNGNDTTSGTITMAGAIISANTATITHSGTTSLTIASTAGTVIVEGVTFTGTAISDATNTNWDAAYSHISNNGTDHSYIDQDVTTTGTPSFTSVTVGNSGFTVGSSVPFSDAAGTLTLQNIDALDATTETTIENAIDTLANLTSVQGHTVTLTGNLIRSGAHALTLTTTGTTNVTLPTTGTLATTAELHNAITLHSSATTGGLSLSTQEISFQAATTSQNGYLTSTDWNTFNSKQDTISTGNLTETTSSVLTIVGGTGAVIGSGLTIEVDQADTDNDGYLSSTDWDTFNGKANADQTMYIGTTAVAINRGSGALTLVGITLTTPNIGTPSAGVLTNCTGLPVAGLANGTDGELITWDAAGVAATVAVGTAGHVLTSNGAGAAPTFQAVSGSGDVVGPSSAVDNNLVTFDLTTGKLVQDGGVTLGTDTNTYSLTRGTASLDIAAGSTLDVNANLTVSGVSSINQNVTTTGTPSFTSVTATTVNATTLDTNIAAAGLTLSGTTLAADGTDANIDITLTPKGAAGIYLTDTTAPGTTTNRLYSVSGAIYWNGTALGSGTGDVTASASMTDNTIVRGDGGSKGVQDTGISIDDADAVTSVETLGYKSAYPIGNSSTAFNLTLSNGQHQTVTLTGDCAMTIVDTGNIGDGQWTVTCTQGGVGSFAITSATVSGGTVKVEGGDDPTFSTAVGAVDTMVVKKEGTVYYIQVAASDWQTWT